MQRFCMIAALAWIPILISGCSGNLATHPVAGIVEFEDGTRPQFGDIEFYSPAFKLNARGKIKKDGTFTVSTYDENDGAVEGYHEVIIMQQVGNPLIGRSGNRIRHDHGSLIDMKYFDYQTSDLSCEIESGENEVRLVLKKMKRQTKDGMPIH